MIPFVHHLSRFFARVNAPEVVLDRGQTVGELGSRQETLPNMKNLKSSDS